MATRDWHDLSPTQQRLVYAAAAVEMVLTGYALRDLARRPAREIRGPKALWSLAAAVQPVGPVAYLVLGRRPA